MEPLLIKYFALLAGEYACLGAAAFNVWIAGKLLVLHMQGYTPQMIQDWIFTNYHILIPLSLLK